MNDRAIRCWVGGLFLGAVCAGTGALGGESQSPAEAKVFDVPRLEHIAVDGRGEDWGDKGFRVEALISPDGAPLRPEVDQDATFRLGWNDEGLLVLITLRDQIWIEAPQEDLLWQRDSVDLYLGGPEPSQSRDVFQWVIAPGMDAEHPDLRWQFHNSRRGWQLHSAMPNYDENVKPPAGFQVARTRTDKGCVIEALLPWSVLNVKPKIGQEATFQLWVNDWDVRPGTPPVYPVPGAATYQPSWFPELGAAYSPWKMHRIRLAEFPSPPVTARAAGHYDLDCLRALVGVVSTAGKTVTILEGGKPIASAPLTRDDRRMQAEMALPLPPSSLCYGPLTFEIDGQAMGELRLNDGRKWLMDDRLWPNCKWDSLRLAFRPCVFNGTKFPPLEFENPSLADTLLGRPYFSAVKVRFFDASYQEVKTAEKPGRYGAIAEIQAADGAPLTRRFITLFHTAEPADWSDMKVDGNIVLPHWMGVKSAVADWQQNAITKFLESSYRNSEAAILLAWLSEDHTGEADAYRKSPGKANDRWWYQLKRQTGNLKPLRYAVHVPEEAKKDPGKRFPAILFLHGADAGGVENPLNIPLRLAEKRPDFPFIVITAKNQTINWESWAIKELVDEVLAKYPIDPDRLHLTGYSLGGIGTYSVVIDYPQLFAAVVPVCGAGNDADFERIKDVPIWLFDGDKDFFLKGNDRNFAALKRLGARVRYSRAPGLGHAEIVVAAYHNEELYKWLLQQKRGQPQQPRATPESAPDTSKLTTP